LTIPRRRRKSKKPSPTKIISEKPTSDERYIVTLFADIVGCSEISNHKNLREYNDFLNDFRDCFKKICNHYMTKEYKKHEHPFFDWEVRGDEGCLKIFTSADVDFLPRDIDTAINIALDLKRVWLFKKNNESRILHDGLLPVNLGIGIHAGKVFINPENTDKYRPEGYAINLAKRIESESRSGKFAHILISETARGQLYRLRDESTYRFDKPFTIHPKGITRNIQVFEIKHHFLPTDWKDIPSEVSIIYKDLDEDKINISSKAYEINPTNLWLSEEHLLLTMLHAYQKLSKEGKEDDSDAIKEAYSTAHNIARHIANTEQRDAGLLGILGLITGEQGNYKEEQKRYEEALGLDEQDGDIHWYLALSMSDELFETLEEEQAKGIDIKDFYEKKETRINDIFEEFERAAELRDTNPWIVYDWACELSWWSQVDESMRKKAIDKLIYAFVLNSDTKDKAKKESYLKPIIEDGRVKKFLQDAK
jgi:class 3 adenylate cyclase